MGRVLVGRTHEILSTTFSVDFEIPEESADAASCASCARPDSADGDGARNHPSVGEGGKQSHSRAGSLPTALGRESNRAVVEGDQFADGPLGVCTVARFRPALVGSRVSCREHRESDGRDDP